MKEVKLVIDGLELEFGLGDDYFPCVNCRIFPTRPRCGENLSEYGEAMYNFCNALDALSALDNPASSDSYYRVISCKTVTETAHAPTATLNYPCGSMGEEIEQ